MKHGLYDLNAVRWQHTAHRGVRKTQRTHIIDNACKQRLLCHRVPSEALWRQERRGKADRLRAAEMRAGRYCNLTGRLLSLWVRSHGGRRVSTCKRTHFQQNHCSLLVLFLQERSGHSNKATGRRFASSEGRRCSHWLWSEFESR
jgi:hypothetical protein